MREVPNLGSSTDLGTFINNSARMNRIIRHED
jgi:hypothetical protein